MATYKIDKNIPLPLDNRSITATIRLLKVGDSFFAPLAGGNPSANIQPVARRLKIKVTLRTVTEKKQKGIRVWRIK